MKLTAPLLADGRPTGAFALAQLPGRSDPLGLKDGRLSVAEGGTYYFAIEAGDGPIAVEPSDELFSFDDAERKTGRFQPREHVGRIRIEVRANSAVHGFVEVEVLPTKLEYSAEYETMLGDVAEIATEALLQGFSPAALALKQGEQPRPQLLYQQVAFLHRRLASKTVQEALALITANPHRAWREESELQSPGRPVPGGTALARSIVQPGPRVATNGRLRLATLPQRIERRRTDSTFDSVPNRFVKYALGRWREIAQTLIDRMAESGTETGPLRRGRQVAEEMVRYLDGLLATPFFREVGALNVFPSVNQVLHKQEGYREVFHTFALAEAGAALALDWEVDDVFAASQKNIAALYEYWAFLQLLQVVGDVCGERRTVDALKRSRNELSLSFREGVGSGVQWETEVEGRLLEVEVFFNRTFGTAGEAPDGSWSRAMRPDCSVHVRPQTALLDAGPDALDVWLHFDAKYRVDWVTEQFDSEVAEPVDAAAAAETTERIGRSRREDLLKMHAYKDAIRRSAGAFVLFPGTDAPEPFTEFTEVLPGLGAFVLRPAATTAVGADELAGFIRAVLEHVADRTTRHERGRYWQSVVGRGPERHRTQPSDLPQLGRPPADTPVLWLGFDSVEEMNRIELTQTVAIPLGPAGPLERTGYGALGAEWICIVNPATSTLWKREGPWRVEGAERQEPSRTAANLIHIRAPVSRSGSLIDSGPSPEPGDAMLLSWAQVSLRV